MELFPAIDLRDGKAVRLLRGDYEKMTVYGEDPLEVAVFFKAQGAKNLHMVDLDGAKDGGTPNFELISRIVRETGLFVEVGGGIRSLETIRRYLENGVSRVIIGTAAVTDPDFLKASVREFGERLAVGVDIRGRDVAIHGWTESSSVDYSDFCKKLQNAGVRCVICTDVSKDGAMEGVNLELYRELTRRFDMDFIASGGVTVTEDLEELSKTGVSGAILGKSLYTGSIDLKAAVLLMEKAGGK